MCLFYTNKRNTFWLKFIGCFSNFYASFQRSVSAMSAPVTEGFTINIVKDKVSFGFRRKLSPLRYGTYVVTISCNLSASLELEIKISSLIMVPKDSRFAPTFPWPRKCNFILWPLGNAYISTIYVTSFGSELIISRPTLITQSCYSV